MSDEPQEPSDDAILPPAEKFRKTTHIALLIAYDLIDKLRYWEKETVKLPVEQIERRQEHLVASIEQLRVAYLDFPDLDS